MSWHNYLVILDKKLLVDLGNHVYTETFLDDLELMKEVYKFSLEAPEEGISDIKINKLDLKTISLLSKGYSLIERLSQMQSSLVAIGIAISEDLSQDNAVIIGEDLLTKYKGFTII